jgi:hypothetical protein
MGLRLDGAAVHEDTRWNRAPNPAARRERLVIKTGSIRLAPDLPSLSGQWNLGSGSGLRRYVSGDIQFDPGSGAAPFGNPPTVVLSLGGIDVTGGLTRIELRPVNIQQEEFNILVEVYEDCTLDWVWVTWFASDGV